MAFKNQAHRTGWFLPNYSLNTSDPSLKRANWIIPINTIINDQTLAGLLCALAGFIFVCGESLGL